MQVTETNSEGLKRELKIIIEAGELDEKMSTRLDQLKSQVTLKGFRQGKVPLSHLRKLYGRSVMAEVIEQAVTESSQKALDERQERPAFEPHISLSEDQGEIDQLIKGETDLSYMISFEIIPQISLSDLSQITVEKIATDVPDQEIEDGIERLAENAVTYDMKEGPAEEDDQVTISFVGKIDGEVFDGGSAEDVPLVLGGGDFIPGFEEGLLGVKQDEQRTIEAVFPDNYQAETLSGKTALFEVTVKQVEKPTKPEVNDAFAANLGVENLENLRQAIALQVKTEYEKISKDRLKRSLLDALDETHDFELPPTLVEKEFDQIWTRVTDNLKQSDRTFEDEGTSEDEARKDYLKISNRRIKVGLILSEIGNKNNIGVSEDEVKQALLEYISSYPGQEKQIIDFYQNNPQALAELKVPIFEQKVVDYILELANVVEKKVSPEELLKSPDDDVLAGDRQEEPEK